MEVTVVGCEGQMKALSARRVSGVTFGLHLRVHERRYDRYEWFSIALRVILAIVCTLALI